MRAKVIGIEKHPKGTTVMGEARAGETVGIMLKILPDENNKNNNGTVAQLADAQLSKS